MIIKSTKKIKVAAIIGLSLLPILSFAVSDTPPTPIFQNIDQVVVIINRLLAWVYTIFFIVAAIAIIIAAYTYLTAGGSDEKITKAKKQLLYAIVAIAIALLALSFTPLIRTLLGSSAPQSGSLGPPGPSYGNSSF